MLEESKFLDLVEDSVWEHSTTGNLYSIKAVGRNVKVVNQYIISYKALKTGVVYSIDAIDFFEEVNLDGYSVPRFRPVRRVP